MKGESLLKCVIAGFVGLILATVVVPGVKAQGSFIQAARTLLLAGVALGLVNFFIKPLITAITFPLRWLTLGLFGLVVNMAIVWGIDILFTPELTIKGILPLFWTALIVWLANLILGIKKRNKPKKSQESEE